MTLKTAALFALIGMILLTVLEIWHLTSNIVEVTRGLAPAVIVLSSLIYAFAALCVTVFFFVFYKTQ
jgi:hypothetical protein